ncbi:hypothetical protein TorRG33x02_028440 [Trema orientale]|uniref:Uncharacterized protein n=1 Tax=Trema orientale TaxID=63057 RepID=A0A2P5FUU9_TREOI|nr:hypothetical protein TorRG33x02_028440 [Trema orientale]
MAPAENPGEGCKKIWVDGNLWNFVPEELPHSMFENVNPTLTIDYLSNGLSKSYSGAELWQTAQEEEIFDGNVM